MAEKNIVSSLFGMTPESYYQNQNLLNLAEQQLAATTAAGPGTMLNPSLAPLYAQAAQRGQLQGGALKAIGSLLGVEDPQLQMVRDVTEMRKQFDVSTPTGLRSFAQALGQKGYTDLAIQASSRAADIDKELSQAEKNRMEKLPAATEQADRVRYAELVQKYGITEGAKRFTDEVTARKEKVQAAGAVKPASNISGAVRDYQLTVKPYTDTVDASENVVSLINEAQSTKNPTAYEGARVQLARAIGNSSLSRKDIEAAGGDPSISGKIVNKTSELFTGIPTEATLKDIARAANIVKRAAQMKKDTLTMQQRDIAEKEFGFTTEQLDRQFPLTPKPAKLPAAGAQPKKVMTWEEFTRPQQ